MRTFADWKKENIDLDARLDADIRAVILQGLEAAWNDGQTVGLDRGLKADRFEPAEDDYSGQFADPKREELLRLASSLVVAVWSRPDDMALVSGSNEQEMRAALAEAHGNRAKAAVSQASAIIAEVDRVSANHKGLASIEAAQMEFQSIWLKRKCDDYWADPETKDAALDFWLMAKGFNPDD